MQRNVMRTASGISRSLGPLRDVVASLDEARRGQPPAGNQRRRLVRRVRAAGVAAVPALVRALGSSEREADWAGYLLRRLGGARVVERVSRLLEDPRTDGDARARALDLLADLSGAPSREAQLQRSVRKLCDSVESEDDAAQAAALIAEQVPADELGAFVAEVARHGGERALPLLDALAAALPPAPDAAGAVEQTRAALIARRSSVRDGDQRRRAFDLLEAGRLRESRRLLERAVAADPDDGEALSFLGVCCLELEDAEAALVHLDRAVTVEPDEALHHWNLAAAAKAADQLCRCYAALARYLELPDALPAARERRREARGFVREYERTIARSHPGVPLADVVTGENLFHRAFAAFEAGRLDEAAAGFEHVLELVPRHYPSWGNLGAAYFALGRPADARRCLRRALELNPDYEVARENLARLTEN